MAVYFYLFLQVHQKTKQSEFYWVLVVCNKDH